MRSKKDRTCAYVVSRGGASSKRVSCRVVSCHAMSKSALFKFAIFQIILCFVIVYAALSFSIPAACIVFTMMVIRA